MASCPNCELPLQTVRQRDGIYYSCDECHGRAATIPQIRRTTGDHFVSGLMRQMKSATGLSALACPFCQAPMRSFQIAEPSLSLNACKPCTAVWFDAGKFEQLPEGFAESPDEVLLRGLEVEATWKLEEQQRRDRASRRGAPDEPWKWAPALLGFPVKYDSSEASSLPWATWALAAIITAVSIGAFFDLDDAVQMFGLIPAEAFRYGGATFLTSFFLHGGILHLVGNLYFFLLFGGEVEDYLGRRRFLALIFLSALVGDCFHILGEGHSMIPCIGASGGISGVLVFYALKFPGARLAFFWWRFGWIQVPAWAAFILWLLMQMVGASLQRAGLSHVSSLAHLGGVTTGFVLWLLWRKLPVKDREADS